jgi:tellurite resistance protein TehA-like permease
MGTGIVAIAGADLPFRVPGLHMFEMVVWAMVAAALLALTTARAVR